MTVAVPNIILSERLSAVLLEDVTYVLFERRDTEGLSPGVDEKVVVLDPCKSLER